VYVSYSLANASAAQGSAQHYVNYNSIVLQAYGALVLPNGAYADELRTCLTAGKHVDLKQPDIINFDEIVNPNAYPEINL
jgi:hypothetical protein